ncbi:conserved hypothetical protein [Leishmania major strain Friedlin]|uniref:Uncharacterized protein n=1 Tax=Leishmania major TaxID=5664 RepID=Q4Q5E0_LEIMA|nr:conserved hypothetical protein [Leishmania major strain Friedlin]CAG9580215.1 hypothetical_protein_-_conserved [Leishmania major strain Friedlin]CAJ08662.1 conserved hypothetical protein [Leishmania major strain Friedlin]|eukprot:XP_001685458.1 conserved hypothetical protein [Leishmania major strain Friedlin]
MPFFGVDDILFLLASTTALLWAKRADVVESSVYTTVSILTDDPHEAARRAAAAGAAQGSTPTLLLKGFDLQAEEANLLYFQKSAKQVETRHRPELSALISAPDTADRSDASASAPLFVKESVHTQFHQIPVVYQVPQVPHRHYNLHKRRPHVSSLATASEEDVKERIASYSVAEVQALFGKMEREGLWEAVIHVSYGIDQANQRLRYLNQHNVECAIRTLLNTSHADVALIYYFRFGEDMLVSDEILVALFHTCRNDEQLSLELCHVLQPFKSQWTPTVYACCLTTAARFDYQEAIRLYHAYIETQRSQQVASQGMLRRVLAASALLCETGVVAAPAPLPLDYLYHVMIPLVIAHDPASADTYVADMLVKDAESAPDVLLKCLGFTKGQELAWRYLEDAASGAIDSTATDAVKRWVLAQKRAQRTGSAPLDVAGMAIHLYRLRPSAMNMNTLLKLCTECVDVREGEAVKMASTSVTQHEWSTTGSPKNAASLSATLKRLASGRVAVLTHLLLRMPLRSELDATVLARTITEQHASWGLATQFLSVMLRRKCFNVVPSIAAHVALQGQWATAAKSMAIYFSNQRAAMTAKEAKLCIDSCVHAGQWASALFWVERAHAKGLALGSSTYDLVLGVSRHCSFDAAERVVTTMHDVGASCSEQAILDFIETAAHRGKVANALSVLRHHRNIEWTP